MKWLSVCYSCFFSSVNADVEAEQRQHLRCAGLVTTDCNLNKRRNQRVHTKACLSRSTRGILGKHWTNGSSAAYCLKRAVNRRHIKSFPSSELSPKWFLKSALSSLKSYKQFASGPDIKRKFMFSHLSVVLRRLPVFRPSPRTVGVRGHFKHWEETHKYDTAADNDSQISVC